MNIVLWSVAGLLAVIFLVSGVVKLIRPKERLAAAMGVLDDFGAGTIKAVGVLEILAAVGLVLPAALDIAPVFVPLAAAGVALLMAGAFLAHLRRREVPAVVATLAFLALAAFVAWGRFGPESFTG